MKRSGRVTLVLACAIALGTTAHAPFAQLRPGQPAVIEPPPVQPPPPPPDVASEFLKRYQVSGSPRILLYWDAELTDRARADTVYRDRISSSSSRRFDELQESTSGNTGTSQLKEGSSQAQAQQQREISVTEREEAARNNQLSARNAAQLKRAFESEMRRGGTWLVDRAMAIRATALDNERAAGNSKVLEAAAARDKADLLLQVLLVADHEAPVGYGFDVTVRSIRTGLVLASFYTVAAPPPPPVLTRYVAGDRGFEKRSTPTGSIGLEDVAVSLAHEVMARLGPVLPLRSERSRP